MFQTNILKKIKIYLISVTIFLFKNLSTDEVIWKNIVDLDRSQMMY